MRRERSPKRRWLTGEHRNRGTTMERYARPMRALSCPPVRPTAALRAIWTSESGRYEEEKTLHSWFPGSTNANCFCFR